MIRRGLKLSALAAIALLGFAAARPATATVITFDGLAAGPIGTTYIEKGYQFYSAPGDLYSSGVGGADSFDTTPGSATLSSSSSTPHVYLPTTVTRVGGGAFNLLIADFADGGNTDNNFTYQFIFNFVGGASLTQVIMLDGNFGSQTIILNHSNLLSVQWGNDPGNDPFTLQWDNVKVEAVSPVPLPAALPLFAAALGAVGIAGWCRRKRHPKSLG